MQKVRITEVHDGDGNLSTLEAYDAMNGDHVLSAIWDPTDEHTPENRAAFRAWFNTMLARKNCEPVN